MRNSNGFSLIEVLAAFSIIFMITTTVIPLTSLINKEEEVLRERRHHANQLHDELQTYLWGENKPLPPATYAKVENSTMLFYRFTMENDLVKGCVKWKNVKNKKETFCLYGYSTE
ncbi:type II secretion system GspH family protein [Virgibacillus dakarensis]|uniref:type II secretion system protein n=1 Tax=Virgibacillus dakarensis TaxID=1917889 RepID=UPI000B445F60|nr:type II secretion system protein [Virgibacillus dakarensis]MBT2214448.1 type II secretion system GspH family protein [Virgibacillus dakarensis]